MDILVGKEDLGLDTDRKRDTLPVSSSFPILLVAAWVPSDPSLFAAAWHGEHED